MRNYASPSRSYYVNELKNNKENLNKPLNKLDLLEKNLDKLLVYSFQFFHPFFKDNEYESTSNTNYQSASNVDKDFDDTMEKYLPQFLLSIITFLTKLYNKLMGKTTVKKVLVTIKKFSTSFKNKAVNYFYLNSSKIFNNKSSP